MSYGVFQENWNIISRCFLASDFFLLRMTVPVEGQLELRPQFGKMVENLVNCTQYQTKKLTPFYQVGSESGVIDWNLVFLKVRIHNRDWTSFSQCMHCSLLFIQYSILENALLPDIIQYIDRTLAEKSWRTSSISVPQTHRSGNRITIIWFPFLI